MGVLHYALNHTKKQVFALGKTIYIDVDKLPKTYDEMYALVWDELNPAENFVDPAWGTVERAQKIAQDMWAFGVEGYVSDTQDELIQDVYANYKVTGSIYENDGQIGQLFYMHVDMHNGTMVVETENGYERRKIDHINMSPVYSDQRRNVPNHPVPVMYEREEIRSIVGSSIPFITTRPVDPMKEFDDLHEECLAIADRMEHSNCGMSHAEKIKVARYYELARTLQNKMGIK